MLKGNGKRGIRLARLTAPPDDQPLLTPIGYQHPMQWKRSKQLFGHVTGLGLALVFAASFILALPPLHAGEDRANDKPAGNDTTGAINHADRLSPHAEIRRLIEKETANTTLPPDIAEAVVFVESGYDSSVIGGVGEMGLMQVRPQTAAMLGFRGSDAELAKPEINIHYGVTYLSRAWRLAGGDLCRALMKYRAGHGEEVMTPLSQTYCARARKRLLAMNSAWASSDAVAALAPDAATPIAAKEVSRQAVPRPVSSVQASIRPEEVYAHYRQGTAAASNAFWAAHEARVRQIRAQVEARWRRVASR